MKAHGTGFPAVAARHGCQLPDPGPQPVAQPTPAATRPGPTPPGTPVPAVPAGRGLDRAQLDRRHAAVAAARAGLASAGATWATARDWARSQGTREKDLASFNPHVVDRYLSRLPADTTCPTQPPAGPPVAGPLATGLDAVSGRGQDMAEVAAAGSATGGCLTPVMAAAVRGEGPVTPPPAGPAPNTSAPSPPPAVTRALTCGVTPDGAGVTGGLSPRRGDRWGYTHPVCCPVCDLPIDPVWSAVNHTDRHTPCAVQPQRMAAAARAHRAARPATPGRRQRPPATATRRSATTPAATRPSPAGPAPTGPRPPYSRKDTR